MPEPKTRRLNRNDFPATPTTPESLALAQGALDASATLATAWPVFDEEQFAIVKTLAAGLPLQKYEHRDKIFVVKALSSTEWNQLLSEFSVKRGVDQDQEWTLVEQDERISHVATIWPHGIPATFWSDTLSGIPATISSITRRLSGLPIIKEDGTVFVEDGTIEELSGPTLEEVPEPTEEQFVLISKNAPGNIVMGIEFPEGYRYVYTPLPRNDWRSIQNRLEKGQPLDGPLETCKACVRWGNYNLELLPAGLIDILAAKIMDASGFSTNPIVTEL